jgi:hypothetical protein
MSDSAEDAAFCFLGEAIKQVGPGLVLLGQRQRAIAGGADVVLRDHSPSPARECRCSLARSAPWRPTFSLEATLHAAREGLRDFCHVFVIDVVIP